MDESDVLLGDVNPPLRRQSTAVAAAQWTAVQLRGRINALLVCVPLGIVAEAWDWNPVVTLVVNFLAILPLSDLVSNHCDHLADFLGPLPGGLINATLGNAVELTYGILAIARDRSHLAQSVMVGSILSDILLVNGACIIAAAGWKGTRHFHLAVVDSLSSLMMITSMALVLPTVLYATNSDAFDIKSKIRSFSRAASLFLLLTYLIYIYFQFWTHKAMFIGEEDDVEVKESGEEEEDGTNLENDRDEDHEEVELDVEGCIAEQVVEEQANVESERVRDGSHAEIEQDGDEHNGQQVLEEEDEAVDNPEHFLGIYGTIGVLLAAGAMVVNCTRLILANTAKAAEFAGITQTFVATILVPVVSNAPECSAVIIAAHHSRINFAVGVIVGSILQIGLFVLPLLVVVGWAMDKEMTLYLDTSQTCIVFLAVLTVNHLLQDGSYTYLHGILLIGLYSVFVMAILVIPDG